MAMYVDLVVRVCEGIITQLGAWYMYIAGLGFHVTARWELGNLGWGLVHSWAAIASFAHHCLKL